MNKEQVEEWHEMVFNDIINSNYKTVLLKIPRRFGKTHMLLKLANHYKSVHAVTICNRLSLPFAKYHSETSKICLVDNVDLIKSVPIGKDLLIMTTSNNVKILQDCKIFEMPEVERYQEIGGERLILYLK